MPNAPLATIATPSLLPRLGRSVAILILVHASFVAINLVTYGRVYGWDEWQPESRFAAFAIFTPCLAVVFEFIGAIQLLLAKRGARTALAAWALLYIVHAFGMFTYIAYRHDAFSDPDELAEVLQISGPRHLSGTFFPAAILLVLFQPRAADTMSGRGFNVVVPGKA